jgi:hypothetical protein
VSFPLYEILCAIFSLRNGDDKLAQQSHSTGKGSQLNGRVAEHHALEIIYLFAMPRLSKERSSSVEACEPLPLQEPNPQSLPALPSSPSTRLEDDDLPYRISVGSVSTLCSEKDHEDERRLEASDGSVKIALRSPWITRLRSIYALQHIGFILDGVWAVVLVLIPSFLRPKTKRKLYPTSYLDGLRGIAGFFVVQVGNTKRMFTPLRPKF